MKRLVLLFGVFVLGLGSFSHAQWTIQLVDSTAGLFPCIRLDRFGYPHVGYSRNPIYNDVERFAYWDGFRWQTETVDSSASSPGHWGSLALDTLGRPHLAYLQGTGSTGVLRYAYWDGAQWVKTTVDTNDDTFDAANIVVDRAGGVHFACHWTSGPYMKYMYWNGSQWWKQVVDSSSPGDASGLGLDSLGRPHLSFQTQAHGGGDPVHCYWNGSSWVKEWHNDPTFSAQISSIALDSLDWPQIFYYASPRLKYMRWNGTGWDTMSIADSAYGSTSGLVLDALGRPHVAYAVYRGSSRYRIEHAWWNGSSWQKEIVDTTLTPYYGYLPSLDMDSLGFVWVAYTDSLRLKVAHRLFGAVEQTHETENGRSFDLRHLGKTVSFTVNKPSWAELTAYDILGRKASTLYSGWASSGETKVAFPARLRSGVYFLRLTTGERSLTRKMVWLR